MPLLPVTIAFMAGVLAGNSFRAPVAALFVLGAVAGFAAMLWRLRPRACFLALIFLWFALGMIRCAVWRSHPAETALLEIPEQAAAVILHATLIENPVERVQAHGQRTVSAAVAVKHIRRADQWLPFNARLQLTVIEPQLALEHGDSVLIEAVWQRVPGPANPGQYDWRAALLREHVHGIVRVKPSDALVRLKSQGGFSLTRQVHRLRHRWQQRLEAVFNKEQAALLRSLLLGERSSLEDSLEEAFIETGTMHLLVVSGFNVGLIAWLAEWVLRLAGVSWRLRPWIGAAGIAAYCVLTGMQPPVVRAGIMGWMVLGAIAGGRVVSWPNTLAAAALLMLILDPMQLFDPSFQLSFGAVASLIGFTACFQPAIEQGLAWIPLGFIRKTIALSVAATAAIGVGLTPLLAWYFQLVAPVSFLANCVVVPLVTLIVGLGTPLLLLSGIIEPHLFAVLSVPLKGLLEGFVWILALCHRLPAGHFYVAQPSLGTVIGYAALLIVGMNRVRLNLSRRSVLIGWLVAALVWALSLGGARWYHARFLRVDVVDVGHGDSLVIRTPRRRTLVVDCGTQEAGKMRLLPFLRREGITSIDALVLTHTDEDHLGGAIPLLEQLRVKRLLTNGVRGDTRSARRVLRLVAEQKIVEQVLRAGEAINLESGIGLRVLHPPAGLIPGLPAQSNDNSVVLELVKGRVSFLLTGDIEEKGLPRLMQTGKLKPATVLKVPHHGSRLGDGTAEFFNAVKPQLAIISVGRLHRLPAQDTLDALRRAGARIDSTVESGMISLKTDGRKLFVKRFRGNAYNSVTPHGN